MYESELGTLNKKREREMFTNIYKSKSIRLEFYIKALENKILSFKTQLHHLCFLLLECSKDSIEESDIEMKKINENSNYNNSNSNNDASTPSEDEDVSGPTERSFESSSFFLKENSLYNFFLYIWIQFIYHLKPPVSGTSDEKRTYCFR